MAVNKMNEYVAQVVENARAQQSCSTTSADCNISADEKVENQGSTQASFQSEAANYELPKRTSDVAAWYQEFVLKEQEEELKTVEEEKTEKSAKKDDEEEDPIKKKLKEAEKVIKSLQRMLERIREAGKKQQETKKKNKGKLSYNPQRVSTAISTAKTSAQASNALTTATSNLSSLKRKAISGNYDDREIQLALQHAYKMIRTARKKVNNMKAESIQQRKNASVESQAKQQGRNVHRASQKQKIDVEIAKLQKELRAREKQKKNRNRREEDLELFQADMEYLKRRISQLQQESYESAGNEMTSGDMVAAAVEMENVEMTENAQESSDTEGKEAAVEAAPAEAAPVSGGFDVSV